MRAETPSVLLIYTGGTIGMIENPETGALENFNFDHLLKHVPELKNDRYFPLEICFWAGDNLSVMMYQIGGVQLVGIYVLLLYLCAKNDYSKSVVNSMQKPVEKSAVEKNSETPMDKGQKPNETQESRVEEKYYYCCKQQQQYWRGKEDCCCCCSDFGFGE